MGKIQVLSFEVANLIAAGEVVDRPASAIKEMMENAIDAGARHITVEIQGGGVTLMRVTDDGCGISEEDLPMAVKRHATSKICSANDLDTIETLGFRGEALAAISSVSDMRILSKRREDAKGHILEMNGGTLVGVREFSCPDGTTVMVERLFANVPARLKFLKRDMTEAAAVHTAVEKIALSHPEIAVRFLNDGETRLDTPGDGKLRSAVYAVFGRDFCSKLLPVDAACEGITVRGYIGRSDNVKASRSGQCFFINGRYVKSKTAQAAIEQAFASYLPQEKFPVCVLNIGIRPGLVDVNVHPAKLEVKFTNEKPVFEAVYYAVRQALQNNTARPSLQPTAGRQSGTRASDALDDMTGVSPADRPRQMTLTAMPETRTGVLAVNTPTRMTSEQYRSMNTGTTTAGSAGSRFSAPTRPAQNAPAAQHGTFTSAGSRDLPGQTPYAPSEPVSVTPRGTADVSEADPDKTPEELSGASVPNDGQPVSGTAPVPFYRVVGEVFHAYIIVEQEDRMLLIDKHAAHERIIFERLKEITKSKTPDTQYLMFPIDVPMMSDECALISQYADRLEDVGFEMSVSQNCVSVSAIPSGINPPAVPDMLCAFAEGFKQGGDERLTRDAVFEKALYQASCKAAIKAGVEYPEAELTALVDTLMRLPDITFCPHGRPVALELTHRRLDSQFERC